MDPTTILVVEAEETFVEFLERFSPEHHSVLFAATPAEAEEACRSHTVRLLVVAFEDEPGPELDGVLAAAADRGTRVIGLTAEAEVLDTRADRLVQRTHIDRVVAEARLLLEESGKARRTSADLKEALASMKPDEVVAPVKERPGGRAEPQVGGPRRTRRDEEAPTIETEPAPPAADREDGRKATEETKPAPDKAPTVETKPAPQEDDGKARPRPAAQKRRDKAPAKKAQRPPPAPRRRDDEELQRLRGQVEKLTAELARTRRELTQQLDQRERSAGVRDQIDELIWDLGEMRKEAQDARDALQKRLDAQDEQIRTLEQQLEQVVQGAQEGSQVIGRTALLDSMKEESTSPRLHQLQLETPGAFLAPDVAPGPPAVRVGGVDEEADTGVFQEDAVTSRVDIDVRALLGDEIQPPRQPPGGEQEGEVSSVSNQDPMFLLSPASITGPGSPDTGAPATVSVMRPFDGEGYGESSQDRDTIVEEVPPGVLEQPPEPAEDEQPAPAPVLSPAPAEPDAEEPAEAPEEHESSFEEAEEIPLASRTGGPRAIRTLEVDRPVGIGGDEGVAHRLPVPVYLLVLAGAAVLALIAALTYYFWPRDPAPPPPPPAAKVRTEAPAPAPAAPAPDLGLPDSRPPPDLAAPPDVRRGDTQTAARRRRPGRRRRRGARWRRRRDHAILLKRAARLIRKRQHARAREVLTRALELRDDFRVRELMARSHDRAGELWPAAYHLERAIARAPARVRFRLHDRLGLVMLKLGKKGRACKAFRAAVAAAPRPDGTAAATHLEKHCQ